MSDTMHIEVSTDEFRELVTLTGKKIPTRPATPVLAAIVLEATQDGTLTSSAYDYDTSIQAGIQATITTPGKILVAGKLLASIASALPEGRNLTITTDGTRAVFTCGKSVFTLMLIPGDEYPALPEVPPVTGRIGSDLFAAAVTQVAAAAGKDDTLPALTGIRAEIDGKRLILVATDRYRLAIRELDWDPAAADLNAAILIPAHLLTDAARALTPAAETTIHLHNGDSPETGIIAFTGAGRTITSRLLSGKYPKYKTLLPKDFQSTAEADTAQLTAAVKRVALVAAKNTPVRLTFTHAELTLEAGTGDEAQATETIPADFTGDDDFTVAFNPHFLIDGIGATGVARIQINFTTATRPAVITGKPGDDTSIPDYRYVIMPIRAAG